MNPTFIMMVGLPYSGKSYYAEKLSKEYGAVVHSSDAIRAEILGDVQDQNNNGKVFEVLHRRVYDDLSNGKSVIYDATNINYKRRMDAIQRLKRIPCEKVCYSLKAEVFDRLFQIGKPFAMLVGVVGLFESQKRFNMFKTHDFEIMYMNKRISYFKDYAEQKPSLNPPFSSVYVCKDILPKQIVFEEVDK